MLLTRMLFVDDDIDVKFRRQITVKTEVGEFVYFFVYLSFFIVLFLLRLHLLLKRNVSNPAGRNLEILKMRE